MNISGFRQPLALVGLFLAVASCGPAPQAGGGIGGTGSVATVSSGPVTKFGSVFVSGTEYDNSNATYCIDDDRCSSTNTLKLGMVVLVNGRTTERYSNNQPLGYIADTITYEETVEGTVQSVAADGLSVTVLGQVIHIDQKTIIDASITGQSVASLIPGTDRIEVSGFVVGDGHILATLIMMQSGTPHYEVQGTIKNHKATAQTFEIGALLIDYSDPAADISRMPSLGSATWNGLVVHIRGEQWNNGGGTSGGTVAATSVSLLGFGIENSEQAQLEGFILQVNPGDFVVNNLRIQTTSRTIFEGGTLSDLVTDTHVVIQGHLVAGILQAEQVSFEGEFELESNVVAIESATRSLTLAGLPGMTVFIDDHTAIDGEGNLKTFGDIHVGDHLQIHGRAVNGGLRAIELERDDPNAAVKIQGPVRLVSEPILSIGGTTVDTSGISDSGFIGKDGTAIGRSTFFRYLAVGQKVSLSGTWTGTNITWTSARLKS